MRLQTGLLLAGTLALGLTACKQSPEPAATPAPRATATAAVKAPLCVSWVQAGTTYVHCSTPKPTPRPTAKPSLAPGSIWSSFPPSPTSSPSPTPSLAPTPVPSASLAPVLGATVEPIIAAPTPSTPSTPASASPAPVAFRYLVTVDALQVGAFHARFGTCGYNWVDYTASTLFSGAPLAVGAGADLLSSNPCTLTPMHALSVRLSAASPTPAPSVTPCSIAAICKDPPPLGNQNGVCAAGNGNGNAVVGQPCSSTPTPSPAPSPTAPPLTLTADWYAFGGVPGNTSLSAAQVTQNDYICIGGNAFNSNATPVAITTCPLAGPYATINMGQPSVNGSETNWPFHGGLIADADRTMGTGTGNCPNPAGGSASFWKQATTWDGATIPDYYSNGGNNWIVTVNGGTIGNANFMGAGWTSIYRFYTNLNSATLQAFVNSTIQNCQYTGSSASGVPTNSLQFMMQDNAITGIESQRGSIWQDYPTGKNFGTNSVSPFADLSFGSTGGVFSPSTFFNGSSHTRTSLLTASDVPVTYPSDTSWMLASASMIQCCTHRDGTPFLYITNGGNNNLTNYWTLSHHLGTIMEEYDTGCFGACASTNSATIGPTVAMTASALGYPQSAREIVDNIATQYNDVLKLGLSSTEHIITLADQSPLESNQNTAGGASYEQNLRWHFYVPWLAMSDDQPQQWISMIDFCAQNTCANKYGYTWTMPNGRYQPMPADPSPAPSPSSSITNACGESTIDTSGARFNFTGRICGALGARDPSIGCNGNAAGQDCVEFRHYYVEQITGSAPCTQFSRANWTANGGACVHDIGPALLIVNMTSSTNMTISAANLALWAPHIYSSIAAGHIVSPCNDNISGSFPMFNWTSGSTYVYRYDASTSTATTVCGGSSGSEFNVGGAPASGDAVYHDYPLANVLNDLLTAGQGLLIVP